ncbi:class IV adenylate cyclase [Salidesulfovibrio onnuriiensis]|uniref:class IV adenylate cyclase n=1 Tax=Salidesulfovibrio onnuriiensis TaxID=2583823 RepID=UPI0011CC4705|nr:class IV adenylate cyclase [Salidesulfovibrio onnuriiensis]
MALEMELKYVDVDFARVRGLLQGFAARSMGRYFEENLVFDDRERSLKRKGMLLRLRLKRGQAVLTVKKPPQVETDPRLKVFEELETPVHDFAIMRAILESLDYSVAFAYEKVREKWELEGGFICLDTLPFGDFVEIEGDEKSVPRCAGVLELSPEQASRETYHGLNLAFRRERGMEADESFLFSPEKKSELLQQIGKE